MLESDHTKLSTLFAAVGVGTRLAVLETLMRDGERSAGDLHALAGISPPAMSRHLKVLRDAGLMTRRVEGQKRMYSARQEARKPPIDGWPLCHGTFWEAGPDLRAEALEARVG